MAAAGWRASVAAEEVAAADWLASLAALVAVVVGWTTWLCYRR